MTLPASQVEFIFNTELLFLPLAPFFLTLHSDVAGTLQASQHNSVKKGAD